ncbi:hypothetical protein [Rhizobium leguminosarum]|uniref:hypothetical protein n=1 Tax=Rhizobium TaxID=379 RepID=UPI001030A529|nr:hypothetical protein [Rhizobium leguminosarum]TBH55210.1 hypothetical protein ELG62_17315 [Rhizobium leguminosarum]
MSADVLLKGMFPEAWQRYQHLNLMATGKSSDLPVAPLKALAFLLLSPAGKEFAARPRRSARPVIDRSSLSLL